MAKTWDKFKDAARLAQEMADALNLARNLGRQLLDSHDAEPFTDADQGVAYVLTDASGNVKGRTFTPTEYLDFVSFYREFEKLLTNQVPGTGFWNGKIAKLLSPQQG